MSSYLRRHAQATVRVSAALLIAASLAACGPSTPSVQDLGAVQPLTSEVRTGLPAAPGSYPVVLSTLGRDGQGIYHFAWQSPSNPNQRTYAAVSRLRLAEASSPTVEVPASGDPILYLPPDVSIPLIASYNPGTSYSSGGGYTYWRPFYGSSYRGTAYYDPPVRTAPSSGSTIQGSNVSTSPAPPSARTVGVRGAVAARAGGTGSGTAATNKSGASTSSIDHGGAAAAKSSSFSAGRASSSGGSSSS